MKHASTSAPTFDVFSFSQVGLNFIQETKTGSVIFTPALGSEHTVVSEPSALTLLGASLLGYGLTRRWCTGERRIQVTCFA